MLKPHYLYTKEGVKDVLGLSQIKLVNSRIKNALALGLNPSMFRSGIEYFDIDMLENPSCFLENQEPVNNHDDLSVIVKEVIDSKGTCDLLDLMEA